MRGEAVDAVSSQGMSVAKAAQLYGMPQQVRANLIPSYIDQASIMRGSGVARWWQKEQRLPNLLALASSLCFLSST